MLNIYEVDFLMQLVLSQLERWRFKANTCEFFLNYMVVEGESLCKH